MLLHCAGIVSFSPFDVKRLKKVNIEGTANLIKQFFVQEFKSSARGILSGLIFRGKLQKLKEKMDPRRLNGGVFVGLNGLVIKSHGSSDSKSFYSALRLAKNVCKSDYN
mgnify:CR=1 FL=1